MARQVDSKLKSGTVVGHIVRYLPKKEEQLDEGVTITRQHKIGAFVQITVDRKLFTVPCQSSTKLLEMTEQPTNEHRVEVFNAMLNSHPAGSERTFREVINPKNKKHKRYVFSATDLEAE
jgi:hypothetical protein